MNRLPVVITGLCATACALWWLRSDTPPPRPEYPKRRRTARARGRKLRRQLGKWKKARKVPITERENADCDFEIARLYPEPEMEPNATIPDIVIPVPVLEPDLVILPDATPDVVTHAKSENTNEEPSREPLPELEQAIPPKPEQALPPEPQPLLSEPDPGDYADLHFTAPVQEELSHAAEEEQVEVAASSQFSQTAFLLVPGSN